MFLNYILNYNLTSLVSVQYAFNFSLDIFEIPFIYAVFLLFCGFCLFNFKFKKHMFSSEIRLLLDNLSEKLFLYNQIYMLFPVLSFLIIPSDDLLCDMKHITVSFSDTRKILQARFSVCGR